MLNRRSPEEPGGAKLEDVIGVGRTHNTIYIFLNDYLRAISY
jgi:hypothetical protein